MEVSTKPDTASDPDREQILRREIPIGWFGVLLRRVDATSGRLSVSVRVASRGSDVAELLTPLSDPEDTAQTALVVRRRSEDVFHDLLSFHAG